jgi:hypothetical protein
MIDAKQAVNAARDYFREITDYTGEVTVEEIELDESEKYWWVTLGYLQTTTTENPLQYKEFKAFRVRTNDGTVTAMKIRNVAG